MILQPLISWWAIAVFAVAGVSLLGWQFVQNRNVQLPVSSIYLRQIVLFVVILLMTAGPSMPGGVSSPGVGNLDVVFVVDTTASMGAEDYRSKDTRMQGVKNDMLELQSKLRGATISVVTFDSAATVHQPFSADSQTFAASIEALNQEIDKTSKGTAIDRPIDVVAQQLKNSQAVHPERSRMLFYLGDGEQTDEAEAKTFSELTKYLNGGAVLGYGTSKGAKIRRFTGLESNTRSAYINTIDPSTKQLTPAISKLDKQALTMIAKDLKVSYHDRNGGGVMDTVFKESRAPLLIDRGRKVTHYLNVYWLFAAIATIVIFWELQRAARLLITFSQKKSQKPAPKTRKKKVKTEARNV